MNRKQLLPVGLFFTLIFIFVFSQVTLSQSPTGAEAVAQAANGNRLTWQVPANYAGASLALTGPQGFYIQQTFTAAEEPSIKLIDSSGSALADGQYTFELRFNPLITEAAATAMEAATKQQSAASWRLNLLPRGRSHLPRQRFRVLLPYKTAFWPQNKRNLRPQIPRLTMPLL